MNDLTENQKQWVSFGINGIAIILVMVCITILMLQEVDFADHIGYNVEHSEITTILCNK